MGKCAGKYARNWPLVWSTDPTPLRRNIYRGIRYEGQCENSAWEVGWADSVGDILQVSIHVFERLPLQLLLALLEDDGSWDTRVSWLRNRFLQAISCQYVSTNVA